MELFDTSQDGSSQPLAYRMRPRNLDEYIGQEHIIGEGRLLRRAIAADQLSSVIFYGPPGTGKTTLARVIANTTKSHFSTLNAVLSGVKQLREEIEEARNRLNLYNKRTILFIDEVHRWNKSQQDALLPWVENGTCILIGATTENPYFEVNAALVSRSRIFQLQRLSEEDLRNVAEAALKDSERGYGAFEVSFSPGALEHLLKTASGDARSLLNALELAVETSCDPFPPPAGTRLEISQEIAEQSIQQKAVLYDKEGDYHFDVISAFIKSLRGSDPDAALYWLARMVKAGEDPRFIFRRMLISACEDVGMADPQALVVVQAAASAFDRVGLPEGRFHLSQAALYLATAPKSNSSLGFFQALKKLDEESDGEVPNHLKDSSRDKKGFGHGQGYLYPHAFNDHWVAQQYLPGGLQGSVFYDPSDQGYEKKIGLDVRRRREEQLEAWQEDDSLEILTFSPPDTQRDRWLQRLSSQRSRSDQRIREHLFDSLSIKRHDTILILEQGAGLLVWEACRQTPEGGVCVICDTEERKKAIDRSSDVLGDLDRPQLFALSEAPFDTLSTHNRHFELIMGMHSLVRSRERKKLVQRIASVSEQDTSIRLCERIPAAGQRLSSLCENPEDLALLEKIEQRMYADLTDPLIALDEKLLLNLFQEAGFTGVSTTLEQTRESRRLRAEDIRRWLEGRYTEYGPEHAAELAEISKRLSAIYDQRLVEWKVTLCYLSARGPLRDNGTTPL